LRTCLNPEGKIQLPLHQPVKHLLKHHVVKSVLETDAITKAVQVLDECDISALPVRNVAGRFCGVISKSDIASMRCLELLKEKKLPDLIHVRDLMNRNLPVCVDENHSIADAVKVMHKRRIHRVFVLDSAHHLIGVLSTSDILRFLVVEQHFHPHHPHQ
jgi:predicted transcriptional regulator